MGESISNLAFYKVRGYVVSDFGCCLISTSCTVGLYGMIEKIFITNILAATAPIDFKCGMLLNIDGA